ncbi:MAG: hypothetical protein V8S72_01715 [Oscillospiraceae bacterium]
MKRKKNGAKTAILCIFKGETLLIITSGKAAIFGGITEMAKEEKDKRFYKIYSRQVAKALYEKGFSIYKITPNPTLAGCKVYWFWVVDGFFDEFAKFCRDPEKMKKHKREVS